MNQQITERRRLLQLFTLCTIALPAAALAGCAQDGGGRPARPARRYGGGGGNHGGEKSGGGGGGTAAGGRN